MNNCVTASLTVLALSVLASMTSGCAAVDDNQEEEGSSSSELSAATEIEVGQFNPYYAGMYNPWAFTQPSNGAVTYVTMATYATLLHQHHPNTVVIGMEEIGSQAIANEVAKTLGPQWQAQWCGESTIEETLQSAIFWRDDVISHVALPRVRAGSTNNHHKNQPMYFCGALLGKRGTTHHFGFFAGKLAPITWGAEDYAAEATNLMNGIDTDMKPYPNTSRVITVDQNDDYGAAAWKTFEKKYSQSADQTKTWESKVTPGKWFRFDFIWADWDGGAKQVGKNFVGTNDTMGGTGSDHRAIFSTLRIAGS